jgi:hypothetical protein
MSRAFVLINGNTVRPPVNPLGLEYVGEHLLGAGVRVSVVDLSWEEQWRPALSRALSSEEPLAVGIGFRNLDDCSSVTRTRFLPWLGQLVAEVKRHTASPVVLGGVGFSIAPEAILRASKADLGIAGDGEDAALLLAACLQRGLDLSNIPNLVFREGQNVRCNPRSPVGLGFLQPPPRKLFDNPRYQAEGAMVGVETKRGCPEPCIYCADPLAKGKRLRLRPPETVVREMANLAEQDVFWFHLCDSEFNLPPDHAKQVCRAILEAGLQERIRWYTYCAPLPFDGELAGLMAASGCAGVNFGVDSLCDEQLRRLGRRHRLADVEELVRVLRKAGLNFFFDMLLGGIGETGQTLQSTAEACRRLELPLVGVAEGMRVYPGTPLCEQLEAEPDTECSPDGLLEPRFYFSPALGEDPPGAIRQVLGDDPRFLLLARDGDTRNYNYVGDDRLCRAIAAGARGAYWDIIRRGSIAEGENG